MSTKHLQRIPCWNLFLSIRHHPVIIKDEKERGVQSCTTANVQLLGIVNHVQRLRLLQKRQQEKGQLLPHRQDLPHQAQSLLLWTSFWAPFAVHGALSAHAKRQKLLLEPAGPILVCLIASCLLRLSDAFNDRKSVTVWVLARAVGSKVMNSDTDDNKGAWLQQHHENQYSPCLKHWNLVTVARRLKSEKMAHAQDQAVFSENSCVEV